MGTETIDTEFQATIQRLGLLSTNAENVEGFIKVYSQAILDTHIAMIQVENVDKLRQGIYHHRILMLKAMLQRQFDLLGMDI